ncbi:hypothetical protein [Marinisporobacter balticus]|uniref:Uncharacterized protein n=1 Tax=Marinisporobacter balticus TaxID=2018667 RepID=A0A4R2L7E8_9FIRM|nr:hypothetical protein [Marinisporobacter balticus]TCO80059.1 hypothetical protein EV214_101297 [Marinisporobacter balticus]
MSRSERKKNEKSEKKNIGKKCICIFLLFFLMISGILVVDDSFRMMMMIEEPKVIEHHKINEKVHEIGFCGEKFYIDEEKIYDGYIYIQNQVKYFMTMLKEKKNNFSEEQ